MRCLMVLAGALALSACMQEAVRFKAGLAQQAITRDGQPALISQKKNSIVMIRPAARRFAEGSRPVFVVAVHNLTRAPFEFHVNDIAVTQVNGAESVPMKVFGYDDLVAEEETRQVVTALFAGAATGVAVAVASQAGHRTRTTTANTPSGSYSYQTTSYSPSRAIAAQNRAARQGIRLADVAIRQGQANLEALEREVLKDNTLMPGEWYGGTLHVQAPADTTAASGAKRYAIAMTVGPDRHVIDVVQQDVR